VVLLEKGPTSDSLEADIRRAAGKYEVSVPTHYVTPSNVKNAKYLRIKDLEFLLNWGRLKFASGPYIDALFLSYRASTERSVLQRKRTTAPTLWHWLLRYSEFTRNEKEPSEKSEDEMEKMQKQAELKPSTREFLVVRNINPRRLRSRQRLNRKAPTRVWPN